MITLLDPRAWLALLLACAMSYGAGRWQQWRADEAGAVAERLAATEQARAKEADWQSDVEVLNEVHQTERSRIAAAHHDAVASLRQRPRERLPEAATPACAGASPAALAADDAEFLVRLAADADALRAEYAACRGWIEAVTR